MPIRHYRYCPQCSRELAPGIDGDTPYKVCRPCDVRFYDEPKVAVVAMILDADCVLLVKRLNDPEAGSWCLPGGFMNVAETPQAAVTREVAEECGLTVADLKLLGVFPMFGDGRITGVVIAYAAVPDDTTQPPRAGDDADEVRWFKRGQLPSPIAFETNRHLLRDWSGTV